MAFLPSLLGQPTTAVMWADCGCLGAEGGLRERGVGCGLLTRVVRSVPFSVFLFPLFLLLFCFSLTHLLTYSLSHFLTIVIRFRLRPRAVCSSLPFSVLYTSSKTSNLQSEASFLSSLCGGIWYCTVDDRPPVTRSFPIAPHHSFAAPTSMLAILPFYHFTILSILQNYLLPGI